MSKKVKIVAVSFIAKHTIFKYILKVPIRNYIKGTFKVIENEKEFPTQINSIYDTNIPYSKYQEHTKWLKENIGSEYDSVKTIISENKDVNGILHFITPSKDYVSTKNKFASRKQFVEHTRNVNWYHVAYLTHETLPTIKVVYPVKNSKLYKSANDFDLFYKRLESKLKERFPDYVLYSLIKDKNKKIIAQYKGKLFYYDSLYSVCVPAIQRTKPKYNKLICIKHKSGELKRVSNLDYEAGIYDKSEWLPTSKSAYKKIKLNKFKKENKGKSLFKRIGGEESHFGDRYLREAAKRKQVKKLKQVSKYKTKSPLKRRRIRLNKKHHE